MPEVKCRHCPKPRQANLPVEALCTDFEEVLEEVKETTSDDISTQALKSIRIYDAIPSYIRIENRELESMSRTKMLEKIETD